MTLPVCPRCSRVNPRGAYYCYFDGLALGQDTRSSVPLDAGSQPFLSPFQLPSGRKCNNFNELVLAAEEHWDEMQELLRDGYLSVFLAGIGRADLARAANETRKKTVTDRLLEDFLQRLPSTSRAAPKLHVQPCDFHLGRIARGEVRRMEIHIVNEGMGMLRGTVSSVRSPWLMIGEAPGVPDKVFECRRELTIPLQVMGDRIRARIKPLHGKVMIETNGGSVLVAVIAEKPPCPFPEGVLMGATTPRELASKARGDPKEAAPLFEKGCVKEWYDSNGWDYPIQGPHAVGVGAVQQFFEALGLTAAPRVEISDRTVKFQGKPGESLEQSIQVSTPDNRPVFAHAVSETPWLKVGNTSGSGKTVKIPLLVPSVPSRQGESLLGRVMIHANGGQRFTVAVFLRVLGMPTAQLPETLSDAPLLDPALVVTLHNMDYSDPKLVTSIERSHNPEPPVVPRPSMNRPKPSLLRHLIGPALILFILLGALIHDATIPREGPITAKGPPPLLILMDPHPRLAVRIHDGPKQNRLEVMPLPTMRFGLVLPRDPDPVNPGQLKRLTFDEWGRSNNTCLRINGSEVLFGEGNGEWVERYIPRIKDPDTGLEAEGFESVWRCNPIEVRQTVQIVPGRQSRLLDTCLVRYTIVNKEVNLKAQPIQVGLRFLLDTHMGSVDGAPFTLPGRNDLCDTRHSYVFADSVPDFIEAVERDDLRSPGTVARIHLRIGRRLESPSRVKVGAYPTRDLQRFGHDNALGEMTLWHVPSLPIRELKERMDDLLKRGEVRPEVATQVMPNSAVTLYWDEKPLAPGAKREIGFAYGLGKTHSDALGKLLISMGGRFTPGGEMTMTALVHQPSVDEVLTLQLPEGLRFHSESKAQQNVPHGSMRSPRLQSVVTWRFQGDRAGTYELLVRSNRGAECTVPLLIYALQKESEPGLID